MNEGGEGRVLVPQVSKRLHAAAEAELAALRRRRERLMRKRDDVQERLAELDGQLAELDERVGLLERLAPPQASPAAAAPAAAPATVEPSRRTQRTLLRGPAIREAAVRLLAARPDPAPVHYQAWLTMLEQAGYEVDGKQPSAVFLTQISRSPAVRKAGAPGIYELDREAPRRLQHTLERQRDRLAGLIGDQKQAEERDQLLLNIRRLERDLSEAHRMFEQAQGPRG